MSGNEKCGVCEEELQEAAKLQCPKCSKWHHNKCVGQNDDFIDTESKWVCVECVAAMMRVRFPDALIETPKKPACPVCTGGMKEPESCVCCAKCKKVSHKLCVDYDESSVEATVWWCQVCREEPGHHDETNETVSIDEYNMAVTALDQAANIIEAERKGAAMKEQQFQDKIAALENRLATKTRIVDTPMPTHIPPPKTSVEIAREKGRASMSRFEMVKTPPEGRDKVSESKEQLTASKFSTSRYTPSPYDFPSRSKPEPKVEQSYRPPPIVRREITAAEAWQLSQLEDLPKFDGRDEDWPIFLAAYDRSVRAVEMTEDKKLSRLTKALDGPALKTVKHWLCYASTADEVMQLLKRKYGRTDAIVKRMTNELLQLPILPNNNKMALENLAIKLMTYSMQMRAMGQEAEINNNYVLNQLIDKLAKSGSLYTRWRKRKEKDSQLNIQDLAEFLTEEAEYMPSAPHDEVKKDASKGAVPKRNYRHKATDEDEGQVMYFQPNREDCPCCNATDSHDLSKCYKFKKMSPKERAELVRKARLCFMCFSSDHFSPKCPRQIKCKSEGCGGLHNTLLHRPKPENGGGQARPLNENAPPYRPNGGNQNQRFAPNQSNVGRPNQSAESYQQNASATPASHNQYSIKGDYATISKVVEVRVHGDDGRYHDTFAFLDDGSELTLMEQGVADKLQLKGEMKDLLMTWTGGVTSRKRALVTDITLEGARMNRRYGLGGVHCVPNLDMQLMSQPGKEMARRHAHLRGLPLPDFTLVKPELLIGLSHANFLGGNRTYEGDQNSPLASKTKLGWVVYGRGPTRAELRNDRSFTAIHHRFTTNAPRPMFCNTHTLLPTEQDDDDENLHELVKNFFATEGVGVNVNIAKSQEEKRAEDLLKTTMRRIGDRYEIGLLWKNDDSQLPDSLPMARKRLEAEERKLRKSGNLQWMNEHFRELIADGYARKASENDLTTEWPRVWYVPMFVVVNHNKVPPKPRVVADAAARESRCGKSLNDFLLTGPDNLIPLVQALCRVREHKVVVNMDVAKMFHQVRISKEDQQCQRFLWRDGDETKTPEVYVMQAMMFGPTCSPAAAQFVKNQHAKLYEKSKPEAAVGLQRYTYADDYFNSHATVEEAVRVTRDAIEICGAMGFSLVQGQSNSREVLKQLPEGHVKMEAISLNNEEANYSTKILGMFWQPKEDVLVFKRTCTEKRGEDGKNPTKRQMLSTLMRVFDPLGLAARFVVIGKKILQEVWREATAWDEPTSDKLACEWLRFLESLEELSNIKIPRWYAPIDPNGADVDLIVFVDASGSAYAAVSYLRFTHQGNVFVALTMAKTKVAPIKSLSIPRLELQAAVLGARLAKTVKDMHSFEINNTVYLSDSSCVLSWIRRPTSKLNAFVSHRIAEISESTKVIEWFKVPTALNVADDATKDNHGKYNKNDRWFDGPAFLKEPFESWPIQSAQEVVMQEEERVAYIGAHLLATSFPGTHFINHIKPEYRASWPRLTRIVAKMLRLTSPGPKAIREERARAEVVIFSSIQQECFAQEWSELHQWTVDGQKEAFDRGRLGSKSALKSLPLTMNEGENVIRYVNRDKHSTRLYGAKNPVLLPNDHELVHTFIRHHHEANHHIGIEATIADIREKGWVIAVRKALQKVTSTCAECIRRKAAPIMPPMAGLHEARVQSDKKPFLHVGVDCFGPIEAKFGLRGKIKRWGVIFTCLTYRAVHLEMVEDMSSSQILRAIRRLMVKRGPIACMYSDRGTNFVGAKNVAKDEIGRQQKLLKEDAARKLEIDWRFNPAYSPWTGGAWERLIAFIKKSLNFTFKDETPTDGIFRDALSEAELLVNKRPLTHTPITAEDDAPLTPNWFLFGANDAEQLIGEFHDSDRYSRDQRDRVRHLLRKFSERWQREYLPRIAQAEVTREPGRMMRVGDVVCIAEGKTPRSDWELGRIVKVHPSSDGIPRIVDVKLKSGIIRERRGVGNIAVLIEESSAPASTTVGSL